MKDGAVLSGAGDTAGAYHSVFGGAGFIGTPPPRRRMLKWHFSTVGDTAPHGSYWGASRPIADIAKPT